VWTCQKKKKKNNGQARGKVGRLPCHFQLSNLLESLKRNHVFGHGCHVRFVFALSFAFQGIEETRQDTNKTK